MSSAALIIIASLLAPPGPGPGPAAAAAPPPPSETRTAREAGPASGDSIGSLLTESSPGAGEREGNGGGLLFRMLGWVSALAVAAVAGIGIWKRLAVPGRATEAGGVRVVGRAALTPKHAIYTVRVANQRLLVVGVSGDRITVLTQFDDPAQVLALDPSFQKALSSAGDREEELTAGEGIPPLDGELSPYRVEVRKLVEVVRGWRGRLGRAMGAEVKVRAGD